MTIGLAGVLVHLGADERLAFEPARPNRAEAVARNRDMAIYARRAAALLAAGFAEEAFARYEDAQVAGSRALQALIGVRVARDRRGTAHLAHKHFLVAALLAYGRPSPAVEQLVRVTRLRNLLTYDFSSAGSLFDAEAAADAGQTTDIVCREVTAIVEQVTRQGTRGTTR